VVEEKPKKPRKKRVDTFYCEIKTKFNPKPECEMHALQVALGVPMKLKEAKNPKEAS